MPTPMGERIRNRREEKGFSLQQLANRAGCTKGYVWELENKNPPRPSAEKLASIAAVLDTTVDVLIGTPINTQDDLSPEDKVFFRKFVGLKAEDQQKMRKMLDLWDDE